MCREANQLQPPPPASVEVRGAYKKYSSSAIVLRGVSLTVRRNTMYETTCYLRKYCLILPKQFKKSNIFAKYHHTNTLVLVPYE